MKTKTILLVVLILIEIYSFAQVSQTEKNSEELRLNLNTNGSNYVKATILNQSWLRFNESNPGSLSLGDPVSKTFDIGLRRTRFQLFGQLSDHVFFYFQVGQNNFNYLAGQNSANSGNRKNQFFIHDALAEYRLIKGSDALHIGSGLTITNGLSRFSQPSIGTIMSMDVPIFAQATVDATDEFSRKLSFYGRGQIGRLDYRLIMSDPFPVTSNGLPQVAIQPINSTFAYNQHHKQYQGFFAWNFRDKESHTTPYMTGTYLGKKNVFNLEAGFISQKNATWSGTVVSPLYYNMFLWSIAGFLDQPIGVKGAAINAYFGYFNTNYGKGYLRYNGIMNPANGTAAANAPNSSYGNSFPMFGTGEVLYAQLGYLLPSQFLGEGHGQLLPYATSQFGNLDRLQGKMNVYSFGVNWLIKGHTSKITVDLQNRPVYAASGSDLIKSSRRNQLVLQYQVFF